MERSNTFNNIASDLVGMKVSHLWRGYGSAIFLEFGALSPGRVRRDGAPGNPKGEITIGIEWSWRIEDATSIVCGSWSEEEFWEPAFDLIRNSSVTALSIYGRLPEIDLALAGGHHLLSFMTAEGQPEWSLSDRRTRPLTWLTVRDGALFESDGTTPRTGDEHILKNIEGRNARVQIVLRTDGFFTYRISARLAEGWGPSGPDVGVYDSADTAEAEARRRVWWLSAIV